MGWADTVSIEGLGVLELELLELFLLMSNIVKKLSAAGGGRRCMYQVICRLQLVADGFVQVLARTTSTFFGDTRIREPPLIGPWGPECDRIISPWWK